MTGGFKRGGSFRGRGRGFKKGFAKRRASPDDDDTAPRASKRSKTDESDDTTPLIPKLEVDHEGNSFVSLKENGTRRVTISEFKGSTLVSIREYYKNDADELLPGKKGISLTLDQYNTFLAAAPLLESVLLKKDEKVVRPTYDSKPAVLSPEDDKGTEADEPAKKVEEEDKEDGSVQKTDDEDEEDE